MQNEKCKFKKSLRFDIISAQTAERLVDDFIEEIGELRVR